MTKPMTDAYDALNETLQNVRIQLNDEIRQLRKSVADQTRYKETALRQLDRIDEHLPEWEGTGKDRIEVIDRLREDNKRLRNDSLIVAKMMKTISGDFAHARELLKRCLMWSSGPGTKLMEEIRTFLDYDTKDYP